MFGINAQIGFVTTKIPNLYITGQNCFWHGVNGAVRTAIETVNAIENKYE